MELVHLQMKNVFSYCLFIQVVVYAEEENLEHDFLRKIMKPQI